MSHFFPCPGRDTTSGNLIPHTNTFLTLSLFSFRSATRRRLLSGITPVDDHWQARYIRCIIAGQEHGTLRDIFSQSPFAPRSHRSDLLPRVNVLVYRSCHRGFEVWIYITAQQPTPPTQYSELSIRRAHIQGKERCSESCLPRTRQLFVSSAVLPRLSKRNRRQRLVSSLPDRALMPY